MSGRALAPAILYVVGPFHLSGTGALVNSRSG